VPRNLESMAPLDFETCNAVANWNTQDSMGLIEWRYQTFGQALASFNPEAANGRFRQTSNVIISAPSMAESDPPVYLSYREVISPAHATDSCRLGLLGTPNNVWSERIQPSSPHLTS